MSLQLQVVYFSIIALASVLFIILLSLLITNLLIRRFVNKLENNYLIVTREQNNFFNSLKRFKALKEQNNNYVESYQALLALEEIINHQKDKIDRIYEQIYQLLKKKKLICAKKEFKKFQNAWNEFLNSTSSSLKIIEQVNSNWDNYDGDITDILNKLSLAREYINKNKTVFANTYNFIKKQIDQYSQKISFIDDQWNNQAKFENVGTSISNLIIDLQNLFEYLNNCKIIEFSLFEDLPKLFKNQELDKDNLNYRFFLSTKNSFYKVQKKFTQYQVDAIKKQIIDFYRYFHISQFNQFKTKTLQMLKNVVLKDFEKLHFQVYKNFNQLNLNNYVIEEDLKWLGEQIQNLALSDFDDFIDLIEQNLRILFSINQKIIDMEFARAHELIIQNGFEEEIKTSLNLYFEVMQNKYLFASEYQENLQQLKTIYEQYFTRDCNFTKVEKVWNRWIELLCYFVEQISINQQYEQWFDLTYQEIAQSDKNIFQANEDLVNQLMFLKQKHQYKESFKLLQQILK
ncbi:hypothetical protein NPA11_01330 [Mycoplasma sp. 1578d]|uniref:hypothetical protein n=1 Tax=Mycoplasma sp. 1578d TaxID=2967299 RepID=UPI00211D05D6|nr:hypothetical protein [Mycoplasma sp. 1578d]UUM20052.1 hypothetical protein NPA11_01330 [Mycoplasma sp. 1578d]